MGLIRAPVSALGVTESLLVAGVGSFVKVYLKSNWKIAFSEKVFERSVIHGFKFLRRTDNKGYFMVVYGGRELRLCKLDIGNENDVSLTTVSRLKTRDWIWDAAFIFDTDLCLFPEFIAVALGHNSVLLFSHITEDVICESHCEEKCILYSAHFINEKKPVWNSLTLCSGTVFNQVVIWKPGSIENASCAAKVVERIQAHDGVIFSIDFDICSGLLVTASDDRSICLWNCESLKQFSSKSSMFLSSVTNLPVSKLYGHDSRVWRAKSIKFNDAHYLVSVGEDGCCIIWELQPHGQKSVAGNVIKKNRFHKGKNIWSLTIDLTDGFIATGGGDAGIRLFSFYDLIKNNLVMSIHPYEELRFKDSFLKIPDLGVLKSIHMCSKNVILGHTDAGVLLSFSTASSSWTVLHRDDNFKSYAIMRVCNKFNIATIANTIGEVSVITTEESWDRICSSYVFNAFWKTGKVHNMTWFVHNDIPKLFISGPEGEFVCYEFKCCGATYIQNRLCSWTLPPAKQRWHMEAVILTFNDVNLAICGDRRGSLHLYKQGVQDPLHTLHGVHGKNGLTSLQVFGKSVISTGRDGIWRKLVVDFDNDNIEMLAQNRAAQGMDWLVSATSLDGSFNNFIILGFHGRNFSVWSSLTGDILFSVECGGGHRDWSFQVENGKSHLAYIKESTLHIATVNRDITKRASVVEPHFHGGQVTSVKVIDSFFDTSREKSVVFLATAGEDTKVHVSAVLHVLGGELGELHRVHFIDDHISSVRALAIVKVCSDDHCSQTVLFTGGGKATINSYLVKITKNKCWSESCEIQHIASHNLNTIGKRTKHADSCSAHPETRYMDLSAWKEDGAFIVAAACSDAVIRILRLDLDRKELHLVAESSCHTHCFLTVMHFKVEKDFFIITGATDGLLRIYPISRPSIGRDSSDTNNTNNVQAPVFASIAHMSGINAMDCTAFPGLCFDGKVMGTEKHALCVATGGDDNSIQLRILNFDEGTFGIPYSLSIPGAHSTQITGLKFLASQQTETLELISTSIDQRVRKWEIFVRESDLKCQLVCGKLSDISDISSLEVWKNDTCNIGHCRVFIAVCGQGIQILDA